MPTVNKQLKAVLDTLVLPEDRDFKVRINLKPTWRNTSTRRRMVIIGLYSSRTRTISAYRTRNWVLLCCIGIHELAHHLAFKRYGMLWAFRKKNFGAPRPVHGESFKKILDALITRFNLLYRDILDGEIVYDPKRPVWTPKFVSREKTERHGNKGLRGEQGQINRA